MLILGIDSATPVASAALADEGGLLGEVLLNVGLTHSEQLLPMIDDLLRQCRRDIKDVTAIGVSSGPGSFTGLRIGMATAKALAQGLSQAPVVAVPTLEAMAWQMMGQDVLLSPMLNARREQIYTGLYRWKREGVCAAEQAVTEAHSADESSGEEYTDKQINTNVDLADQSASGRYAGKQGAASEHSAEKSSGEEYTDAASLKEIFAARQRGKKERLQADAGESGWALESLIPPEAVGAEAWGARLREMGQKVYLLGDGAAMYREIWRRDLGSDAVILPPVLGLCRAGFIALAAMKKLEETGNDSSKTRELQDYFTLKPLYLRGI
ncbi:MAG: tRNA (adenosine(37)-N6)-threonylcarbamoyltransferase complex dimerization subunit type 1 TsaB [Peptococcaceae bacterium]|jgi:tRNA threonylcarbamoyl adenosine modification protein YeaZ|nr:tRNA (adenosine(37)-N6)-threonylcarbamoyltransferase complex dimerization subunit type 1 TsaB [Peptococcaceae bacterium]